MTHCSNSFFFACDVFWGFIPQQVSTNGLISLNQTEESYTPRPFPTTGALIAPYWADADTSNGNGNVWFRVTTDSQLLSNASQQISNAGFTGPQSFSPSYLIIVTWENVGYFDGNIDKVSVIFIILGTISILKIIVTAFLNMYSSTHSSVS